MKLTVLLAIFLAASLAEAQTPPKTGEATDNPPLYTWSHSDTDLHTDRGEIEIDCSTCTKMRDLLFVACGRSCGNAGCDYFAFRKTERNAYQYVTTVFLHDGAFQFFDSIHNGWNDILFYSRLGSQQGEWVRYEFDGQDYRDVGEHEIIPSATFNRRLRPEPARRVLLTTAEIEAYEASEPAR